MVPSQVKGNQPNDKSASAANPVLGLFGRKQERKIAWAVLLAGFALGLPAGGQPLPTTNDWPCYGRDPGGMRYSPLTQIDRQNVARLKLAWVFHTGDVSDGRGKLKRSGFETTPLMVDGTLYLTTPFNRVIALDAEKGTQLWAYDPRTELAGDYGDGLINRGVAIWSEPAVGSENPVRSMARPHRRIFEATLDARLLALDAATGKPCSDFGHGGEVGLRDVERYLPHQYHMTSPPAVIGDVVVVGSSINDNSRVDMPSGVVRAFDVRSGKLRWSWEPIPTNSPTQANTWRTGAANAWTIMGADPERDLVFVPTGSASPDFYGGLRPGDNKWANSIVALRGSTGEFVWGFQLVHHDLWDYDCASPPLLASVEREGKQVPVVVQGNKTGFLFVLNRETGAPVFPVEERPVPQTDVPGETTSPTQPFPVAPPALQPQKVSVDEAWAVNDAERESCRARLGSLRNEGIFTPPSLRGSIMVPGDLGGMTWSGYAFDPTRNLLFANVNNLPAKIRLIPRAEFEDYKHRAEAGEYTAQKGAPYGILRNFLQAPSDLPCCPPPWGMLTAVDIAQGTIRWQVPLGSMSDFGGKHPNLPAGSVTLGGPIVTAGGLLFIGGTCDPFFRAFDVDTGKEIWKASLPASAAATPLTYVARPGGKQFVVVAAGGHAKISEEPQGDAVVAFALP
jgi:quinoprotein glucose dehydrogenase